MHLQWKNENQCITESGLHSAILKDWTLTYDQVSSGRFESFLREISFDGIQIYEEKFKPSIFQRGEALKNSLCLGLFSELSNEAIWLGKNVTGHEILSCCDGDEILLRTPENSAFYSLTIPFEMLGAQHFEHDNIRYNNILATDYSEKFYFKFINLLNSILENRNFLNQETTRQQVKCDILNLTDQFLTVSNEHFQPTKISVQKARQVVKKVCGLLQDNPDYCYSIDELCQLTFTSRRTLQNCFELITGQSPALLLKIIKLNAVRRALLKSTENACISNIAAQWGFWHLSQFSVDYKKLFGETPSQTLTQRRH
ncbi:hypothetical protein A3K93_14540 (plasmid) [Acinetobacter sp. NCu2D-2]|uniref:helix-turn-helix domain-containing protein n=1 Tax=Acinetobacter sp. NCu2D-2 TaxID=1608473 RepID=UPI0007CE07FB|nr:helix-turn-helix domain-containing protein [Acinetobacter sp. NCu2D-2]ANF83441.1 hypothetical protein A3K93_14540 [Acinetobacter sp. NCu2D-2]